MAEDLIRIGLYETRAVIPLLDRAAGSYVQKLWTEGNSLLSSLFVESLDPGASVAVEYRDSGVGEDVGEDFFLNSHATITTAATTDRILVTRVHNKPRIVITVTGGSARFGIYLTVVASFATELEAALKKHATTASLSADLGMLTLCYDSAQGKYFFMPMENGAVKVTGSVFLEGPGTGKLFTSADGTVSTPGSSQTLITQTVPMLKSWKLRRARVVNRCEGAYKIFVDSTFVGSGKTGPGHPTDDHFWDPVITANAGQVVTLTFTQIAGTAIADVDGFLMLSEVSI